MIKENFRRNIMLVQIAGLTGSVLVIWLFDRDMKNDLVMTGIISLLALSSFVLTYWSFQRIKYLEGILRVCRSCKRVNVRDEWIAIDRYLAKHSDMNLTHEYCPDCWTRQQLGTPPQAPTPPR